MRAERGEAEKDVRVRLICDSSPKEHDIRVLDALLAICTANNELRARGKDFEREQIEVEWPDRGWERDETKLRQPLDYLIRQVVKRALESGSLKIAPPSDARLA